MKALDIIADEVNKLSKQKELVILAIDGRCGAGKTTLANCLGERLGGTVLHMDDFFLRPEQRTPERLAMPGENVDHERFLEQVLIPLSEGEPFFYRAYDCKAQKLREPVESRPAKLAIVEGAYCCHPALWAYYDLRVFMTADEDEQLRRISKRSPDKLDDFKSRWIPMEERYFSAFRIAERCDMTLEYREAPDGGYDLTRSKQCGI